MSDSKVSEERSLASSFKNMYSLEAEIEEGQVHDLNMRETRRITDNENPAESLHEESEERKPRYKNIMHLWEFLLELLADESCKSLITWSREAYGEFKLKNQEEVAKRWGMFKHRPNMNYEKLSRALRHYYNQGIIKKNDPMSTPLPNPRVQVPKQKHDRSSIYDKLYRRPLILNQVPGQRLVYKFHKLPYQYTPGKNRSESNLPASPTRTVREDEYCFQGSSLYTNRRPDESERPLTNRDRMRKLLQERANISSNLDKPTNPKQSAEIREVPSPPDLLELPSVTSLPCSRPVMSTAVNPAVCCCGCGLRDVKRLCYPTRIMYPVSAYENFRSFNGWNYYQINSVPVSVITSRYYQ